MGGSQSAEARDGGDANSLTLCSESGRGEVHPTRDRDVESSSAVQGHECNESGGKSAGSLNTTVSASLTQSIKDLKLAKQQEVIATNHGDFFNQKAELSGLLRILEGRPSRITVIVGPPDSGKSKLLEHLKSVWNQKDGLKVFSPFLYIDMRKRECTTPDGLAQTIHIEVESWRECVRASFRAMRGVGNICGIPVGSITDVLTSFWDSFKDEKGLAAVQDNIRLHLARNPNLRPVIVFDEVNRLKAWKDEHPVALTSLAHFLLWITKQTCKGHVIMASSDDFFCEWIRSVLGESRIKIFPIGYFSNFEARAFLLKYAIPLQALDVPPVDDDIWTSIHAVTGGSPHLLMNISQDAAEYESWEIAIRAMVEPMIRFWEDILATNRIGTAEELEGIAKILLQNGGLGGLHVVTKGVFEDNKIRAREVMRQLVQDNIFHVRIWYSGMEYYDLQKFGDDVEFLMAINPAAFAALKVYSGFTKLCDSRIGLLNQ